MWNRDEGSLSECCNFTASCRTSIWPRHLLLELGLLTTAWQLSWVPQASGRARKRTPACLTSDPIQLGAVSGDNGGARLQDFLNHQLNEIERELHVDGIEWNSSRQTNVPYQFIQKGSDNIQDLHIFFKHPRASKVRETQGLKFWRGNSLFCSEGIY